CPLVAVNGEYDVDRAWVQPEVDAFSVATSHALDAVCGHGAPRSRVRLLGVPISRTFHARTRPQDRPAVCHRLGLAAGWPVVLVAGGSEGLGDLDGVAARLLRSAPSTAQFIVLAGRNVQLRRRCERLAASTPRLRVLGWTDQMAELMRAADLMVSKLGHTFAEALAAELPAVPLLAPPGDARVPRVP